MFEVKIGEPVKGPENPKDSFVITATAGYGDADGSDDLTFAVIPNKPEYMPYLEEAIDFCERMKAYFPHGMGGDDTYVGIEGGDKWLGFEPDSSMYSYELDEDDEEKPEISPIYRELTACNYYEGWPGDPMTGGQSDASFSGYVVRYFDNDGVEHEVEITK